MNLGDALTKSGEEDSKFEQHENDTLSIKVKF